MSNSVSMDDTITYLNELIELDRPALAALIASRVPCDLALAEHPSCQVRSQYGGFYVGMIGVLNGLFGVGAMDERGWGPMTLVFEDGNLQRVRRTDGE